MNLGERRAFCLQLGITNHWVSFLVIRIENKLHFYFFDSKNKATLGLSNEEIEKYISDRNEWRDKVMGKARWGKFQLMVNTQALVDQNILINLLMDIFLKKTTIFKYLWHEKVQVNYEIFLRPTVQEINTQKDKAIYQSLFSSNMRDIFYLVEAVSDIANYWENLGDDLKEMILELMMELMPMLDKCEAMYQGNNKLSRSIRHHYIRIKKKAYSVYEWLIEWESEVWS